MLSPTHSRTRLLPGRGRGDGDLPEVVRMLRAPSSVATPQAGPPRAVAADQGDSGGGRLVNGAVPSSVYIPDSLASLVLHNPDNLCYLNAAVFLLAYISALRRPAGPLQGATPLEHSL